MIFDRWSDLIIASWPSIEILVDPFNLAIAAQFRIRANLLVDIEFRYALAFCRSSDSGSL